MRSTKSPPGGDFASGAQLAQFLETEKCMAFSRVQGSLTLAGVQRRNAGRAEHEIPRPERFRPLSDENFSSGKVRELRASPYHFNIFLTARVPGIFTRLHTVPAALEEALLVLQRLEPPPEEISPSAPSLRSWIAAGLKVLHES